jgi:hypothetical protein
MSAETLVRKAEQLFAQEPHKRAAKLAMSPEEVLRVVDKHDDAWYCWNLVETVPNTVDSTTRMQSIGVPVDLAPDLRKVAFRGDVEPNA